MSSPRSWFPRIVYNVSGASITFIVCLFIFCIGYSCLQRQLKSYKTSGATVALGLLHLKNKKGGTVGASSGTLPVWFGICPCEKTPRNWGKGLRTRCPEKQQCLRFPRWLHILQIWIRRLCWLCAFHVFVFPLQWRHNKDRVNSNCASLY
jgi:hypothetical protein